MDSTYDRARTGIDQQAAFQAYGSGGWGISTGHAGQLLVSAGQNIDRLRGESSFAALCDASPIPASSGKTTRHRLSYGSDRDASRALHPIADLERRGRPIPAEEYVMRNPSASPPARAAVPPSDANR